MGEHEISLTLDGRDASLTVDSRTLLVHALRDQLGYTGTKVGCETGKCGACTVRLDGDAVKSCMVLAVQADSCAVRTVEGLAEEGLHPIQAAFREEHGLQCGYCTPGMVLATEAMLEETREPSRAEIREHLKGNLCRCTGYQNIVDAVETAADDLGAGEADASSAPGVE